MHKRAFLASILGFAGGAALTSLYPRSATATALPQLGDPGETGRNGAILAQYGGYGDDHREHHDDDDDMRRRRRREEYDRCRHSYGEDYCRRRYGDPD